mgnify:CR=1 FL=1
MQQRAANCIVDLRYAKVTNTNFDPETGAALSGLQKIGANYYYFDVAGRMQTGWVKVGSRTCYFKKVYRCEKKRMVQIQRQILLPESENRSQNEKNAG